MNASEYDVYDVYIGNIVPYVWSSIVWHSAAYSQLVSLSCQMEPVSTVLLCKNALRDVFLYAFQFSLPPYSPFPPLSYLSFNIHKQGACVSRVIPSPNRPTLAPYNDVILS